MASKILRGALVSLAVVLSAGVGWILWSRMAPRQTPAGQPPLGLIESSSGLSTLRDSFNAASDDPRVIALLSPT